MSPDTRLKLGGGPPDPGPHHAGGPVAHTDWPIAVKTVVSSANPSSQR
jgi:hypothetical protein